MQHSHTIPSSDPFSHLVASGPHYYVGTSDDSSEDQEMVSLRVKIFKTCHRMTVQKGTQLGRVLEPVLKRYGLPPEDCFFHLELLKGLGKDTLITSKMTVVVEGGVIGGVQGPLSSEKISIKDWISELYPENWFDYIRVPHRLRHEHTKNDIDKSEVVVLGQKGAQMVLDKLLDFLERHHKVHTSFCGQISLDDLVYYTNLEVVDINPSCIIDWKHLSQSRYKMDCAIILEFINFYCKYDSFTGKEKYAMHVESLKDLIEKLADCDSDYNSDKLRSLIYNPPAVMSLQKQIAIITNLMIKYHRGFTWSDQDKFTKVLSDSIQCSDWWKLFDKEKHLAPEEMLRVYTSGPAGNSSSKVFDKSLFGLLDFSRCLLSHAAGVTDIEALAALYVLWKNMLPSLNSLLVVVFDTWVDQVAAGQVQLRLPPRITKPVEIGPNGNISSKSLPHKTVTDLSEIWDS